MPILSRTAGSAESVIMGRMRTAPPRFGRDHEIQLIETALAGLPDRGAALVVHGEPGIGKSFLLDEAAKRAEMSGAVVLRTTGVDSEADLPFAGLHQIVVPILDAAHALPEPQRLALLTVFGMAESPVDDPHLVALATLGLLAEAAAEKPLAVLVDDAQWLDQSTSDVLAFVARRLESDPIVLIAMMRPVARHPLLGAGLPEVALSGLDEHASTALLRTAAPALSAAEGRRVLTEARGNPLALLELPTALAMSPSTLGPPSSILPLTSRLERAFAVRLAELPGSARAILLAAAVDDRDDPAEILGTASAVLGRDVDLAALRPAVEARLVDPPERGGAIVFRHPLVRSAVHQDATETEIQKTHAALAAVLTDHPDRRAWHRAAATAVPDEEVALDLEQAAGRARGRGGAATALAALRRAARLTPDRVRRGARLLAAAEVAYELGDHDLATALRVQAEALPLDGASRSRAAWLRGAFDDGQPGDIPGLLNLVALAELGGQGDTDGALQLLFAAARRCWWGDPPEEVRAAVVAAVDPLAVDPGDPRRLAVVAAAASLERGADVIARLARWVPGRHGDPALAGTVGMAAFCAGDFERAVGVIAGTISVLREQGRLGLLSQFLLQHSFGSFCLGEFEASSQSAQEAKNLAAETGQPVWAALAQLNIATVAAVRGESDAVEELLGPVARMAFATGNASVLNGVLLAQGIASLAAERYDVAFEQLSRMLDPSDHAYHSVQRFWQLHYLAEAAVHSGNQDRLRTLIKDLGAVADATRSPGIGIAMRYTRAVLADDEAAEREFELALASDSRRWPYHRARLQLAYGRWLRRRRQTVESREALRAALNAFDGLGVEPWALRTRRELAVAGEAVAASTTVGWNLLSPQERQIATLVVEGLTNREIAQRLFLSQRTIGSHLYRIFPKLGIASRTQLATVLGAPERVCPVPGE